MVQYRRVGKYTIDNTKRFTAIVGFGNALQSSDEALTLETTASKTVNQSNSLYTSLLFKDHLTLY